MNIKKHRFTFFFALLLIGANLLIANSIQAQKHSHQDLVIHAPESKKSPGGMIVGSISVKNMIAPIWGEYYCYLQKKDAPLSKKQKITIGVKLKNTSSKKFNPDTWDGDHSVYFFAVTLPAGEYELTEIALVQKQKKNLKTETLTLSSPVKVTAQKLTYIGEIRIDADSHMTGINDKQSRDVKAAQEKYKDISWSSFTQ
ncbi:MAG TPA: hypothetical protein VL098_11015 [Flavipsychrobacter sp.]|nr:hypothetical protein [Flavipsychrobacter sp.]